MPSARPSDLHHRLVFQPDNYVDLELLDKNRTLIHSEKLFYESEPGAEALVLLFDHYPHPTTHQIIRRPVSLDLLSIVSSVGPPVALRRKSFFSKFSSRKSAEPDASEHALYPLTLKSSGKLDNEFTLYAESASLRTGWALKLEEALALRRAFRDENPVFEMAQVNSNKFSAPIGDQPKGAPWNPDNPITGLITCSTSFVAPNGKLFIAVCCAQGVWFGHHNDSDSFRQVLRLKDVLKCAVLEEFGVIVVLAEKSLFAYHIDALIPGFTHESRSLLAYKLNGKVDVEYFTVGRDLGRTFVIYMKKKGSDSVFRFLEPIPFNIKQGVPTNPNVNSDWFRKYKEFFAMQKTFGAQLIGLDPKILSAGILSAKGIEIHELSEFSSTTIPVLDSAPSEMTKRCKSARVMGLFRSGEREQLICYDKFGLYIDRYGRPSSKRFVEWEGTAQNVAYHAPYILLFHADFIEVRDVATGQLAQIIPATDVRCVCDGQGIERSAVVQPWESRVHAVLNTGTPPHGFSKVLPQTLVEFMLVKGVKH